MKTYRLALSIGGSTFVDADRYQVEDGMIRFFREEFVQAEFPRVSVLRMNEKESDEELLTRSSGEK